MTTTRKDLVNKCFCWQVFDVNLKQAAWFSAIPWGMMAFAGYVAGLASDSLIKKGYSVTAVRKIMQVATNYHR